MMFFTTCAAVDYFSKVLPMLPDLKKMNYRYCHTCLLLVNVIRTNCRLHSHARAGVLVSRPFLATAVCTSPPSHLTPLPSRLRVKTAATACLRCTARWCRRSGTACTRASPSAPRGCCSAPTWRPAGSTSPTSTGSSSSSHHRSVVNVVPRENGRLMDPSQKDILVETRLTDRSIACLLSNLFRLSF